MRSERSEELGVARRPVLRRGVQGRGGYAGDLMLCSVGW